MKTISDRRKSSYQIYDSFRIIKYYFRGKENFNNREDMEHNGHHEPLSTQRRGLCVYLVAVVT